MSSSDENLSAFLMWVCLKMLAKPLKTQWLMIIIPMKNGYFIGNIPYFQTNPCFVKTSGDQGRCGKRFVGCNQYVMAISGYWKVPIFWLFWGVVPQMGYTLKIDSHFNGGNDEKQFGIIECEKKPIRRHQRKWPFLVGRGCFQLRSELLAI